MRSPGRQTRAKSSCLWRVEHICKEIESIPKWKPLKASQSCNMISDVSEHICQMLTAWDYLILVLYGVESFLLRASPLRLMST